MHAIWEFSTFSVIHKSCCLKRSLVFKCWLLSVNFVGGFGKSFAKHENVATQLPQNVIWKTQPRLINLMIIAMMIIVNVTYPCSKLYDLTRQEIVIN